ncbi:MAG: site-specific integrase [Eubacterium sp.]|nr:site-specific integrase [Eubacterium sp.]
MVNKTFLQLISVPILQAFQEFLSDKRSINLSDETLQTYEIMFTKFVKTLPEGENTLTDTLTKADYQNFVSVLQNGGLRNDVSIQSACRNIRVILYWLANNDYCIPFKVQLPRCQKKIKELYTPEELSILLKKPDRDCTECEYITWCIENLLICSGLRIGSLVELKVSDLYPDNTLIVNQTKSNIPLRIAINAECASILRKYFKIFNLSDNDYMFATGAGTQYAKNTIKKYIRAYNIKRGVKKTSAHLFRHSFAASLYRATHDVYLVKQALGHSNIAVTEGYLRSLGCTDVGQRMVDAFNPQVQFGTQNTTQKRRGRMRTA